MKEINLCNHNEEKETLKKLDEILISDYRLKLVLKSALEKQIPKKPINKTKCDNSIANRYENCNIVVCPLCNGRLKLKSKGKYCDKCGQALDWSDSE